MGKLDEIHEKIEKSGKIITLDAEQYLEDIIDVIDLSKLTEEIQNLDHLFITKDIIEKMFRKEDQYKKQNIKIEKQIVTESKIKILYNPGEKITRGVGLNEYYNLFVSRYKKLKAPVLKKMKVKDQDFLATLNLEKKESYNVVGILYSKKIFKDIIWIELEDETGIKRILVSRKNNEALYRRVRNIPLDSVLGLNVTITKNNIIFAKEIYTPSVLPNNKYSNEEVYVVLTSDLHVGSEKFLEKEFLRFIDILNGNVDDPTLEGIIPKIKYFIIAGDIVDGVGIFPNQEKELVIMDIRKQYDYAYNLLSKLPKNINIITIPGNHDATRKALPQPPISKEYAEKFYNDKRFIMLGNPTHLLINEVSIYIYHGDFLQDAFTLIPGITQDNLEKAMKIILETRLAAPTFGAWTRIGPEPIDRLILPEKLDILHTGHIHRVSIGNYNNILMINSGTWQEQTDYQKASGYLPTPGKVPIVNLKTKKVFLVNLLQ